MEPHKGNYARDAKHAEQTISRAIAAIRLDQSHLIGLISCPCIATAIATSNWLIGFFAFFRADYSLHDVPPACCRCCEWTVEKSIGTYSTQFATGHHKLILSAHVIAWALVRTGECVPKCPDPISVANWANYNFGHQHLQGRKSIIGY